VDAAVNGSIPALHLTQPRSYGLVKVVEVRLWCAVLGWGYQWLYVVLRQIPAFRERPDASFRVVIPWDESRSFPHRQRYSSLRRGWRDDQTDGPCLRLCVDQEKEPSADVYFLIFSFFFLFFFLLAPLIPVVSMGSVT